MRVIAVSDQSAVLETFRTHLGLWPALAPPPPRPPSASAPPRRGMLPSPGPRIPEGLTRPGRWASLPHPKKQLPISPSPPPRRHKFKLDLLYIKRQPFWFDLKLIALCFWITLRAKWEHRGQKI